MLASAPMKIMVMGCGGIGGIVAAHLHEIGQEVAPVTTNREIFDAISSRGFQLRGEGAARTVRAPIYLGVPEGSFDAVILATQPPQVEEAARTALPALSENGVMVCLQNGLCEAKVAAIVGEERTVGAVVGWGATMPEPGLYDRTAAGGFTLGRMDGKEDARLVELSHALESVGPCELTNNLAGKRWSKLAINCAISSLGTVGGDRLGVLMQHRFVRRLALEIMTEVVQVARRENVRLEKVSGTLDLDWISLKEEERKAAGSPALLAKHSLLLAVGFRFRRMRSSMLSAIERGRPPAVDFLNGEIVDRAKRYELPARINTEMRNAVWDIAKRQRTSGIDTLRRIFEDSRAEMEG